MGRTASDSDRRAIRICHSVSHSWPNLGQPSSLEASQPANFCNTAQLTWLRHRVRASSDCEGELEDVQLLFLLELRLFSLDEIRLRIPTGFVWLYGFKSVYKTSLTNKCPRFICVWKVALNTVTPMAYLNPVMASFSRTAVMIYFCIFSSNILTRPW